MIPARRRWAAGALLVALGWLLSPQPVPVYDGIGQPDEPYRYVVAPPGATTTAAPTSATGSTPLAAGRSTNGLSVQTAEQGPQFSLFLPPGALAATGSSVKVTVQPQAPADQPSPARIDGNVYAVALAAAGPVTLTDKAAIATLYLRSTAQRGQGPVVYHRAAAGTAWQPLQTSRGGFDVFVASFKGPGQYALGIAPTAAKSGGGGTPLLPVLLVGAVVLLVVVVVAVRLRSTGSGTDG